MADIVDCGYVHQAGKPVAAPVERDCGFAVGKPAAEPAASVAEEAAPVESPESESASMEEQETKPVQPVMSKGKRK
jgi:hypothetical protein